MSNRGLFGLPQGQRSGRASAAPGSIDAIIPVGNTPYSICYVQSTNRLYVSNYVSNTVSVINPVTNQVTKTLSVQSNPNWVCVANEYGSGPPCVYVVHDVSGVNALTRIDTTNDSVTALTALSLNRPGGICAVQGSNNQIIVCDTYSNQLRQLSGSSGGLIGTYATGIGPVSPAAVGAPDIVWIANNNPSSNSISQFNASLGSVLATLISGFNRPNGIAYNFKRDTAVVADTSANQLRFYCARNIITVLATLSMPNPVMPCFVPSTQSVFVSTNNQRVAIVSDDPAFTSTAVTYTELLPSATQITQMVYVPSVNRVYGVIPDSNGLVVSIVPKG